jgi:transposase
MIRKGYPTDLTDEQCAVLRPLLPEMPDSQSNVVDRREIVNALLYVLRSGVPWSYLPHDLPPWQVAWVYSRQWCDDGTLDRLYAQLRTQSRRESGGDPEARTVILDGAPIMTPEDARRVAMKLARKFRDASAILSSVPLD